MAHAVALNLHPRARWVQRAIEQQALDHTVHVRAFNEKSWVYYCEWAWYLGWKGSRFELTHLQMSLSNYGASLELPQEEILRLPRAVDSMYVILKKVPYEDTRVAA